MKHLYEFFRDRFLHGFPFQLAKITMVLIFFIVFSSITYSPMGALKGRIFDKETKEPIPFANIVLESAGAQIGGATSDFDGNYVIKPIPQGTYNVRATYVGYKTVIVRGLIINADQIKFFDIEMESTAETLPEVVVSDYKIPLISRDETVSGGHITSEEIRKMPNRNASAIVSCVDGLFSSDGERGNLRGARANQTVMYIDGIRVMGSTSIPSSAIEQVSVYLGGVPAQYENADSGGSIIELTITNNGSDISSSGNTESENRIQPKLLTAGEINDFSKWELWKDISTSELNAYQDVWEIRPQSRYCVQVMNRKSFPVVDASVKLIDENDNLIWTSKTDNTGKAELWSGLHEVKASKDAQYRIKINYKDNKKLVNKPKVFQKGINSVKLNVDCEVPENVDILFTVDATGSMGDEIEYLKVELEDIIEKYANSFPDLNIRLGSVFYRDKRDEYLTKKSDFSVDVNKTIDFIGLQRSGGGGDGPEAVDDALDVSINQLNWSENARTRLLFLILDAPPHNSAGNISKLQSVIDRSAELGIKVIPITASGISKSTEYLMRSFALATNGTYVFLTDDSGIGLDHIKPSIDDYEVELLNDLILRLLAQYTFVEDCSKKDADVKIQEIVSNEISKQDLVENQDEVVEESEKSDKIEDVADKASMEVLEKIWINAYPNPTRGIVNIEYGKKVNELYVVDMSGKVLQKVMCKDKSKISVDLSPFPNGMYFLKYPNVDHWEYVKVILRH